MTRGERHSRKCVYNAHTYYVVLVLASVGHAAQPIHILEKNQLDFDDDNNNINTHTHTHVYRYKTPIICGLCGLASFSTVIIILLYYIMLFAWHAGEAGPGILYYYT